MQKKDEKHVDKFGYASLMVGDSAALFNQHLNDHGHHYANAAQNIGNFFTAAEEEGQAYRTLTAAQSLLEAGRDVIPLVAIGSIVGAIGSCAQTAATLKQARYTDRIARAEENQHAIRRAEHLLNISTKIHLKHVLKTARFHGKQEKASYVYVILGDSYQSTQMRIFLDDCEPGESDAAGIPVSIFDTIQDAFDAVSKRQSIGNDRVVIYVHSLEPIEVSQDLQIKDCNNFVLQSDASQAFLQPRLIFTGTLKVSKSRGTIRSVALIGGYLAGEQDSKIEFLGCTNVRNACSFWNPTDKDKSGQNRQRRSPTWQILMLSASLVVVISSVFLVRRSSEGRSPSNRGGLNK